MSWMSDNWYVIVGIIALIVVILIGICHFTQLPTSKKIENLKKWLRYAVTEAEKELGEKTGQLKLATVYNMAISKFPWVSTFVSYEQFDEWVKDALEWLNNQLLTNPSVRIYVKGE